jgi:2-C-methyl-D-erythritol 4-phosphate cytidylyltransferase
LKKYQYALIAAGGRGTRLKSLTPKQFLNVNGKPVLLHTIDAFIKYNKDIVVILILPQDEFDTWNSITCQYNFEYNILLQAGGSSRYQSVRNGLQKISTGGLVAIHDGVRPLVTTSIIAASFELAEKEGTAVASVPLKESIRQINKGGSQALDRSNYRLIQTPQTFDVDLIKKAYALPEEESLTDDASVAERAGNKITLFDGSYENLKITTPEDLIIAEAIMKSRPAL